MTEKQAKALFDDTKKKLIKAIGNRKAMNDIQITTICKELFGNKYLNTFSVDKAPVSKPGYMVVNTDKYGNKGIHWVACIKKGNTMYIFDSFARRASRILKILTDKLKEKNIKIVNSDLTDSEQRGDSEVCGMLCIAWLYVAHTMGVKTALLI